MAETMNAEAQAAQLPWRDGDGYSWGGEAVLTIGGRCIMIGSGKESIALSQELARRWNAGRRALSEGGE